MISSAKPQPPQSNKRSSNLPKTILRSVLLDLPLFLIFAAYIAALTLEQIHVKYLSPLKDLMEWTDQRRDLEITAYHKECTASDISARSADELVIPDTSTTQEAVDHMQVHGASIFPNILSNTTADTLRAFIVEENLRQEGWFVISNKNRYSFGIQVDQHPSIALALQEIAEHPVLRPLLDKLVGRNPAVIEFTAITSTYGASKQDYHQDVVAEGSAAKYARSFIPSYSLFIPLQDTTAAMGATDLCPGTQLCGNDPQDTCEEHGFPASGTKDKWPKGWGALLNQQTTHRGTAHSDRYGPERVVFILTFAPRPQYSLPGVVESRLLGQQGSYSMHWRQWGHTLNDFGAATKKMTQPFRTLRSFGLYKPSSAEWGWDIVTVALMRMANGDNGYTRDSLEEFVEKGGFVWLPQWLQASIDEEFDEEEGPLDGGWFEFLQGTFQKIKDALKLVNQYVAISYVVGLCTAACWTTNVYKSPLKGLSVLIRNTQRIALTHGAVLGIAWFLTAKLSKSYWAQNIENGKLFQPYRDALISQSLRFDELKELGFTLPNKYDVLVAPHYRSKYLASYADILEFNQKGNIIWAELVSEHSQGFAGLTPALQHQLCMFLVEDAMLSKFRGRLLHQPEAGRWSVLQEEDDAQVHCYSELIMDQNPLLNALLTEVDHLETESEFGAWRNMAIHRSTIPSYLELWSNRLLGLAQTENKKLVNAALPSRRPFPTRRKLCLEPTVSSTMHKQKSLIPSPPPGIRPPFQSAWFATGDLVEGMYQGKHDEWYRGVIVDIGVDQDTYDVVYDDGELDYGLCRRCIRPFKPFQVGAFAEARVDEYNFERVEIVAAHGDDTYDIYFLDDYSEEVIEHVPTSSLRRFA